MVSKKNKRKIVYEGTNYYWYVRINEHGHRVHIISDDKKVHLEYPFLDTEIPENKGYKLFRKAFGGKQIDNLLEQAKVIQQSKQRGKHFKNNKEER